MNKWIKAWREFVCTFALATTWIGCTGSNPSAHNAALRVSISLSRQSRDECIVTVKLVNTGRRALTFDEENLPWHIAGDRMTVALVHEDHFMKPAIPRTGVIRDPAVTLPVTIGPGEVKSSEVHLESYYNTLPTALSLHDVTVLWFYRPLSKPEQSQEPIVGYLTIPRWR